MSHLKLNSHKFSNCLWHNCLNSLDQRTAFSVLQCSHKKMRSDVGKQYCQGIFEDNSEKVFCRIPDHCNLEERDAKESLKMSSDSNF